MTSSISPPPPVTTPAPAAIRARASGAASGCGPASPLTYVALVVAVVLSVFPLYFMFVIATRTNDAIGQHPAAAHARRRARRQRRTGCSTTRTRNFVTGLVNSSIVAGVVTVSVVFFSSLAGFAFAKLRFRGRNALLLVVIATMMVPTQLGIIPLYMMMASSDLQRHAAGGHRAVPGQRLRRVHDAPVREPGGPGRADRGRPGRRLLARSGSSGTSCCPRCGRPPRCSACSPSWSTWNDFLWPYVVLDARRTRPCRCRCAAVAAATTPTTRWCSPGTLLGTLPLLVVFVLFGRQIIGGIMEGAVKA